jgi:hypothetical protein
MVVMAVSNEFEGIDFDATSCADVLGIGHLSDG